MRILEYTYPTNKRPISLMIKLSTRMNEKIRIIVKDDIRPNTMYMDRWNVFQGEEKFIARMPQSPEIAKIEVGSLSHKDKTTVKIVSVESMTLDTKMELLRDIADLNVIRFIRFIQQFAEESGYKSPGRYMDNEGMFEIDFYDVLRDNNGNEVNTPTAVDKVYKNIYVSKTKFDKMTVPARVALLLHEFCHVFKNRTPADEKEADLHALQIYLALGYPRVELLNVYATIFLNRDNTFNRDRLKEMEKHIMNFDDRVVSVKYA